MATTLTDRQAHALFHYLVQAQAWHELSSLKVPGRISHSGPPFVPDPATPARAPSPVLNALFRRLFLTLPGVRDAPVELWSVHAQGVLEDMAAQDLSDSFDKGALSKRKIVAYGIAVVASAAGRGLLGGLPRRGAGDGRTGYDPEKGEDVRAAWESVREGMVYGDDLHELVDWAAKTDNLADLPPRFQAAHVFASHTFAAFLHYVLVAAPGGPALRALLARVHGLLPYGLVRQALRMGNAASMVSAVLKIFLYRAPSIRGWLKGAGGAHQNLLQSIISQVLSADQTALEKKLAALSTEGLALAQIDAIDAYVSAGSREDSLAAREVCMHDSISIVGAILQRASVALPESEDQHALLHQRLVLQLSIRDRAHMAAVLCGRSQRAPPDGEEDHLSAAARAIVRAFEPVLRRLHGAADLGGALADLQAFLDALLALPPDAGARAYTEVVHAHERSLHRFLHALAKDAELRAWYEEWYERCVREYRRAPDEDAARGGAGRMQGALGAMLAALADEERGAVLAEADAYADALEAREKESAARAERLFAPRGRAEGAGTPGRKRWSLSRPRASAEAARPRGSTDSARPRGSLDSARPRGSADSSRPASDDADAGAGTWLASWQALIDATPTTPASLHGPVRRGAQKKEELAGGEAVPDVEVRGLAGKKWPEMKATEGVLGRFEKLITGVCMRGGEVE